MKEQYEDVSVKISFVCFAAYTTVFSLLGLHVTGVSMCVCQAERENERESERQTDRENATCMYVNPSTPEEI